MSFSINESYINPPCTVSYSILDSSLNVQYTRTIVNPPTPPVPAPPTCFTFDPAFVEITACGTTFRLTLNNSGCCQDVLLFCSCAGVPGWYPFHACLIPSDGPCDYVLNIQV